MINDLDDDLDGLFAGAAAPYPGRDLENDALLNASVARAASPTFREPCAKCGGSGRYNAPSSLGHNTCLACNGAGFKEFRTAPSVREKQRADAEKRRQARAEELSRAVNAWHAQNPELGEWLVSSAARGFEFAQSLLEALNKYGALTPRQYDAVVRCVEKSNARKAEWQAERAAREAAAPMVSIVAIETAFQKAFENKIKWPKLRLADFVFSPAGAKSANAGAVYVKTKDTDQYLGKIKDGRFFRVRECSDAQERTVIEVASNPEAAAVAYGRRFGQCAVCGRELSNKASVDRGIGPICASKYGW